ncbi:MAG: transcription termination factor Rho [Clostridiaceae bacterium]|nr:transcription termination factor Rho [Clostridiaceae bacterium]
MNSYENFSEKKKKDLVAIAVHFGLLTESKANGMSKQNLIDYLSEQERVSRNEAVSPVFSAPQTDGGEADPRSENKPEENPSEEAESETEKIPDSPAQRRGNRRTQASGNGRSGIRKKTSTSDSPENNGESIEPMGSENTTENTEQADKTEGSVATESGTEAISVVSEVQSPPQKRSSRSKKRSIIITPKSDNGYPEESEDEYRDEYPADGFDPGADSESEENSDSENPESGKQGSVRTLRHKEPENEIITGILEVMPEGFGFIRRENYLPSSGDIFIHGNYIRRFGLRTGDKISGPVRPKKDSDKYAPIQYVKEVNDLPPEKMQRRAHFDRLTPIHPDERFVLETAKTELSTRIIDLIAPIGKGQRGMIVSPPKAGKTILLQKIANAISLNNPDAKLIVLLIDERPEEVTEMQRSINGEVVYSTFDKKPENHTKIVELVLERAMRLVELEQDVVILLDSITRLSRAYNLTINPTGRTLSGGLDPGALYGPKRFFGAARNIENGGSLTIIATSLIDTGSRMDEVIFEEFKGTGNMEVYLDRKLSEKRIFPAIDINKSGTRREELLLGPTELDAVWTIRKAFSQLDTSAVTEMIISLLLKTQSNQQFIQSVNVSFSDKAVFEAMRGTRPAGTSTVSNGGSNGK